MTDAYQRFSAFLRSGRYRDALDVVEQELVRTGTRDAFWLTQKANGPDKSAKKASAVVCISFPSAFALLERIEYFLSQAGRGAPLIRLGKRWTVYLAQTA